MRERIMTVLAVIGLFALCAIGLIAMIVIMCIADAEGIRL